jgi:hypothetical protein
LIEDEAAEPHRITAALEWSYDHRAELLNGTTELPARGQFDITTLALDVDYRLPAHFALRLGVPVYWKTFTETDIPERTVNGLGDVEIGGTYDLIRSLRWIGVIGLGAALPTGDTTAQPIAGSVVPTPLQLGTGTFDPMFLALAAYRPTRELDIHMSANGRAVLYANGFRYQAASVFSATTGTQYRIFGGRLAPALDLELAHTTRTSVQSVEIPNTGRDVFYVAPRVRVQLFAGLYAEASLRLPVFQSVNETQFGETVEASFRLAYVSPPLIGRQHEHDEHEHSPVIARYTP